MKHKHYDVIVAWAEGQKIQSRNAFGHWKDWENAMPPTWSENMEWRIKPDTKEDFAVSARVVFDEFSLSEYVKFSKIGAHNVEFLFDGETKELKALRRVKDV
jgi:hypothetical protein